MMFIARTAAIVVAAMTFYGAALPAAVPARADDKGDANTTITDERLNAFVAAAKEVFAVRQKYRPQFEAATTDGDKQKIVVAARDEMKKAVESHGLTIEQYNAVLTAARNDQKLAEKLEKLLTLDSPAKGG